MAYKSSSSSKGSTSPPPGSRWQQTLKSTCQSNYVAEPVYQLVSDRRGGRTAWSATVSVNGKVHSARFWYDGKNCNNAKEDAAEMALKAIWEESQKGSPSTTRSGW
ncbi:hypothetical protein OQA88_9610 [Cercophora sp. LCS_1]